MPWASNISSLPSYSSSLGERWGMNSSTNFLALSYSSFESMTSLSISFEKRSLIIRRVRSSSDHIRPGVLTWSFFFWMEFQSFMRNSISAWMSSLGMPSQTVLMMKPQPGGLMVETISRSLFLSFSLDILLEMAILS